MDMEKIDFNEFNVLRGAASRFLGVSPHGLDSLKLPFIKVGEHGRMKYRQSDLDRVKRKSLFNAESLTA